MLLRLVMGRAQDGQTHSQVPDAALSHGSDWTVQATVTASRSCFESHLNSWYHHWVEECAGCLAQ